MVKSERGMVDAGSKFQGMVKGMGRGSKVGSRKNGTRTLRGADREARGGTRRGGRLMQDAPGTRVPGVGDGGLVPPRPKKDDNASIQKKYAEQVHFGLRKSKPLF